MKRVFKPLFIFIIPILLFTIDIKHGEAQDTESPWQDPTLLFQGPGTIYLPTVIADRYGYVHIFWRYTPSTDTTEILYEQIYYTRWDGKSWSDPVDIVVADSLRSLSAAIDTNGLVDLIWVNGAGDLYFSQSRIEDAVNPWSWSKPTILAISGQAPHIVSDTNGSLFIVFPDESGGVSYISSQDGGSRWSTQRNISSSSTRNAAASTTFLAVSNSGIIHVVWTESQLPDGWPPIGVFYSRSTDEEKTWSPAIKIAGEGYDQINVATWQDGIVHLAWNGMVGVFGRYHRWSTNDGESWSGIENIVDWGATSGAPGLVIDSLGILHVITTDDEAAWYSKWTNQIWISPVMLPRGEIKSSYWIEEPAISIGNGNQLHAVFWSDRQKLWYTTKKVDSPKELSIPLPERVTIELTVTSTPELILNKPSPNSSSTQFVSISESTSDSSGPGLLYLVSLLPVILLICGIIFVREYVDRIKS